MGIIKTIMKVCTAIVFLLILFVVVISIPLPVHASENLPSTMVLEYAAGCAPHYTISTTGNVTYRDGSSYQLTAEELQQLNKHIAEKKYTPVRENLLNRWTKAQGKPTCPYGQIRIRDGKRTIVIQWDDQLNNITRRIVTDYFSQPTAAFPGK